MLSLGYLKCTKNEGLGYTNKGYNNLIAGLTQKVLCMTTKELLNIFGRIRYIMVIQKKKRKVLHILLWRSNIFQLRVLSMKAHDDNLCGSLEYNTFTISHISFL